MVLSKEQKLLVLKLIQREKQLLFSKYDSSVSKVTKLRTWNSIVTECRRNYGFSPVPEGKDGRYLRDVFWDNMRRSAIGKLSKLHQINADGGHTAEINSLVLSIMGYVAPDDAAISPETNGKTTVNGDPSVTDTPLNSWTLSTSSLRSSSHIDRIRRQLTRQTAFDESSSSVGATAHAISVISDDSGSDQERIHDVNLHTIGANLIRDHARKRRKCSDQDETIDDRRQLRHLQMTLLREQIEYWRVNKEIAVLELQERKQKAVLIKQESQKVALD